MAISQVGQRKLAGEAIFLVVNIIVLALSSKVNQFQDFFFIADLFPLALSIISLVVLVLLISSEIAVENAFINRPPYEIATFGVLSVFWLAFNAFSTSRWRHIPFHCDSIPTNFGERGWCKDVQALKSFVWINFLLCFGITVFTLRYCVSQYGQGNKHVFQMPLSRYRPEVKVTVDVEHSDRYYRGSEFLQFEKLT